MTTRRPTSTGIFHTLAILSTWSFAVSERLAAAEEAGPSTPASATAVTFNKDIAPILFHQCANCHRPGEVAPFSLLSYRDASKRAKLIGSVTGERIMPPWKAEPGFGHFANERRLTDDQLALIARWVHHGAPEGDPADLPPAPKFVSGWQLGEPDMVLKMAEPYSLAAEVDDVYRCFVIPLKLPAGKYLKSAEFRPGNRRIVHHAVLTSLPHRIAQAKLDAGDGKSFGSGLAPPGQLLPGPLAFWTPGMDPNGLPDHLAATWPDQADLVLQLHLHPSGKPETELSSIGLHFTDEKPRDRLRLMVMNTRNIDIAPGDANYVVNASMTLQGPVEIHGVFPHMHLLGRSCKVVAKLPDGTTEPVISIGDWEFNWQYYYQYASPLRLPAGTKLEGRWTYDNSAENPANPSKPPKRVTYGEQTTNEMAILIVDALPTGPAPKRSAAGAAPNPNDARDRAAFMLGMADKDKNGKLSREEILPILGDRLTPAELDERIAKFDGNADKQLNTAELAEAIKSLRRRQP